MRRKEVREVRGDESPVPQEIVKEWDRIVIRFGNSTLTLTVGGIALKLENKAPHQVVGT